MAQLLIRLEANVQQFLEAHASKVILENGDVYYHIPSVFKSTEFKDVYEIIPVGEMDIKARGVLFGIKDTKINEGE